LHILSKLAEAEMQQLEMKLADKAGLLTVVSEPGKGRDGGGRGEAGPMASGGRGNGEKGCGVHKGWRGGGWRVEGGGLSIAAKPVDGVFKGKPGKGGEDGEDKDVHGAGYWV
jgi:hypothetical protein